MIWIDYFNLNENSTVLDYGCGLGFYSHALRYLGIDDVWGYEISKHACKSGYGLMKERIKDDTNFFRSLTFDKGIDLIICYDVLEHLSEQTAKLLIEELYGLIKDSGHVFFSICMKGNPMFKKDKTHITEKPRIWWEYWIEQAGFTIIPVPNHFWWRHQAIIAKKNRGDVTQNSS